MYTVELEALDGNPITPRTGKSKVLSTTNRLPLEGTTQVFIYENEGCESPGVSIFISGLEQLNYEFKFYDYEKRPFKLKIIK